MTRRRARAAAADRRSPALGRAFVVAGLTGLVVAQPLLDLLGRNPQFFVAGRYTDSQILLFGILVTVVPALAGAALVVGSHLLHRRAGDVVFVLLLVLLGAGLANLVARSLDADGTAAAAIAAVLGAGAVIVAGRTRGGRMLLQYLSVANVLFLGAFVFASPTSRLLETSPDDEAYGRVESPELEGPVVVVVMDELPLTTLLRDDGSINEERFPRFAELAERSTWFRNASSRQSLTDLAVPTLLTGTVAERDDLPEHRDHPRNLFTLLGRDVPVHRYELVTDLCPPSICAAQPPQPLRTAVEDAAVVLGHRMLPDRLRDDLPAIDHAWGDFGGDLGEEAEAAEDEIDFAGRGGFARWKALGLKEKSAPRQAEVFAERIELINGSPSLHLIHVALPHYPWVLTPSGDRLMELPRRPEDPADPAYDWGVQTAFQLHTMQTGAADVALGRLIDHLDDAGIWDDTTLVVASDHGVSLLPPDLGRARTDQNEQELLRVPLFVHAPGLPPGVRDEPAQTVDLLPTLADVLHVEADWRFDGHSLVDGSEPRLEGLVGDSFAPALEVVRRHRAQTPRGWDWTALAAVGDHGDLVGQPLSALRVGAPSDLSWEPDHEAEFASLPARGGKVPQLLTGIVTASERPPELVVEVNGRIGGVIGGYRPSDAGWRFTGFLAPFLRDGSNTIRAFEVVRQGDGIRLAPVG